MNQEIKINPANKPDFYIGGCDPYILDEICHFDFKNSDNVTIMEKYKIGLDVDGVVADFGTHFLNYLCMEDRTPPNNME